MTSKEFKEFQITVKNEKNLVEHKSLELLKETIILNRKRDRLLERGNYI